MAYSKVEKTAFHYGLDCLPSPVTHDHVTTFPHLQIGKRGKS